MSVFSHAVIAGLDPAIHLTAMYARVAPAHDVLCGSRAYPHDENKVEGLR
jgi:hypothetical protein